jgi:hypothetical protein
MAFHSSLTKRLSRSSLAFAALVFGMFSASATGCGGCDDANLVCDADGNNCQICDGYGCHPADPNANSTGSTTGSTSGTGGAGTGGAGTGGASTGTGGTAPCDPTKAACACASDGCPQGLACIAGVCAPGCTFSYECGGGNVCINGACAPGCDAQTPCDAGYTCDKGACVLDGNNPVCSAQAPCPMGQVCADGLCTSECSNSAQCAAGEICDGSAGVCIPDPSPHKSCSDTVMCTGIQKCLDDGYCHYPCDTVSDCKLIDNRFVACDTQICKTAEEVEPECTLDKPCPAGKDCVSNKCL